MPATFVWESSVLDYNLLFELDRRAYATPWSFTYQQIDSGTYKFSIRHTSDGWRAIRRPIYTQPALHGYIYSNEKGCRITAQLDQRDTFNYLRLTLIIILVLAVPLLLPSILCSAPQWSWYTLVSLLFIVAVPTAFIGVYSYTRKKYRNKQLLLVSQAAKANYTIIPPKENSKEEI